VAQRCRIIFGCAAGKSNKEVAAEVGVWPPLERQPADPTGWSRASMAAESGLSKSTVGRIWEAFGLKPHMVDTFKISNDPQFIEKVRMHHTPAYTSWFNEVERWFALLTDKKLRRGACRSIQSLEKDIRDWIAAWNDNPKPFTWAKPPTRSSNVSTRVFNEFLAQDSRSVAGVKPAR
jgi:hypothetical protein